MDPGGVIEALRSEVGGVAAVIIGVQMAVIALLYRRGEAHIQDRIQDQKEHSAAMQECVREMSRASETLRNAISIIHSRKGE